MMGVCLTPSTFAQNDDRFVLQLKWEHEFQFAGYYAALWQGFYAEQGLDVEIRSGMTPDGRFLAPDQQLLQGNADFGIGGIDALVGRGNGHRFIVLSPVFQRSPVAVFTLDSVPIDSLERLSRLRIAAVTDDYMQVQIEAMFMAGGIDPASVQFIDAEASVDSLVAGLADAIVTYDISASFRARELGIELNSLYPGDNGINFYGDVLYTTEEVLARNPEQVERFVQASLRGWRYALENREEIADRISVQLPRYAYRYDDFSGYNRHFAGLIDNYIHYPLVPLGHNQLERWQHAYFLLEQLGLIEQGFSIDELLPLMVRTPEAVSDVAVWVIVSLVLILLMIMMVLVRPLHLRLLVAAPLLILMAEQLIETRYKFLLGEQQRLEVSDQLSTIRYQLESRLSNNLSLINGLSAFIASNPDFSQLEFDTYAAMVLAREPSLINLAAAPELVIRYIYPLQGNEAALGLDYNATPEQQQAVQRVIQTGSMVIAGPVDLVQGGAAFVGRAPVYTIDAQGNRLLWGIVSAPIPVSYIYSETDLFDPSSGLEIAIRGRDGLGAEGDVFFGPVEVFENPGTVTMPVVLGGGSWQIAAHAYQGEATTEPGILLLRFASLIAAMLIMSGIYFRHRTVQKERAYEQVIFRNEQFLREVETVSRVGGWRLDADGVFTEVSRQFIQIMNLPADRNPASLADISELFSEETGAVLRLLLERAQLRGDGFDTELRLQRRDGEHVWLHIRCEVVELASERRELVGAIQDVTQAKEADSLIEYQANFDALTGLANRSLFRDRLDNALAMARRNSTKLAVLFIDLDNFKSVNDNLGHDVGDEVLIETSRRIRNCVREVDTVARYSGDEFIVVLRDVFSESAVWRIVDNIVAAVGDAYTLRTHQIYCGASVGISFYPDDANDADTLIIKADQAMYEVKKSGRNGWQFYTDEMQKQSERRHHLFNELVTALNQGELTVHYQPIKCLSTGLISGCEALVRWRRSDGTYVPPDTFIPLAEESGLIIRIDYLVLTSAQQFIRALNAELGIQIGLSVNVSTRLLYMRDESAQAWFYAIKAPGNTPMTVEITERVLVEDATRARHVLDELNTAGVSISIDDFGTGYSGLSYLSRFPVQGMKIDRSFVAKIGKVHTEEALIETMLLMAAKLNIKVVAEGVETQQQLDFLSNAHCHYVQGYFIGRPMPAEEFRDYLISTLVW
ncbi:MAG: EAL domain-containing protein [Gammaproteobacteria bacterium]|nr:EAL domain-containing protein [Gammaproteobacteria bacterium]